MVGLIVYKNHGGKRAGSGRPAEQGTKLVRVPVELLDLVSDLKKFRRKHRSNPDFYNNVMSQISDKITDKDVSLIDFL